MRAARRSTPEVATSSAGGLEGRQDLHVHAQEDVQVRRRLAGDRAELRYAMNRDLQPKMSSPAIDFMEDIVGAKAVHRRQGQHGQRRSRRSATTKLRITLTKVAPDFLARITMPFFSAVKTEHADQRGRRLGALEGHVVWSVLRRPSGSPSGRRRCRGTPSTRVAARRTRIRSPTTSASRCGAASSASMNDDTDLGGFPPADAAEISTTSTTSPRQQVRTPARSPASTSGEPGDVLVPEHEPDQPLFKNNDKLRQAVNWAIDRPQMVRQHGALAAS